MLANTVLKQPSFHILTQIIYYLMWKTYQTVKEASINPKEPMIYGLCSVTIIHSCYTFLKVYDTLTAVFYAKK